MFNSQEIKNLQEDLEKLSYEDNEDWAKHLNRFRQICSLIDTYGASINAEEREKKLIRTFPPSLSPTAMKAKATKMDFETLVANVESGMSRRAKQKGSRSTAPRPSASKVETFGIGRISGGIMKKKKPDVDCWVCVKHGHYARDCWGREGSKESGSESRWSGRIGGRGCGRVRGRGRGRGVYNRNHRYDGYNSQDGQKSVKMPWKERLPTSGGDPHPDNSPPTPASNHWTATRATYHNGQQGNHQKRRQQQPDQYGFMDKLKHQSSIVEVGDEKTSDLLVDSGATHNFLHSRSSFI